MATTINICWLRRDLRLNDNAALYHALKDGHPVLMVFIFDKDILSKLENPADRRVEFIYQTITGLQQQLVKNNSTIEVYYDTPQDAFVKLTAKYTIHSVYTNHDYEPYAKKRDSDVNSFLFSKGITFNTYKDQVIFEKDEIIKDDGKPYTVFTPYSKKWKAKLNDFYLSSYPVEKYLSNLFDCPPSIIPSLESMGFTPLGKPFPDKEINTTLVKKYSDQRDYPAIEGTSKLGIHLRFGTISIRETARRALMLNQTYLNELIWREFYQSILWNFPHVGGHKAFKPEYDHIQWLNNEANFESWCKGETGFPIVDAGMRELNTTGFMHNRVRMIVASFLVKDLLIDWRWGEAYFAEKLLDYDLASNNGGWQWAAGSGCDAAPYFRIFNPELQTKKFDKDLDYIKKWVPEFQEFYYPKPIVDHSFARDRCLAVYKAGLAKQV